MSTELSKNIIQSTQLFQNICHLAEERINRYLVELKGKPYIETLTVTALSDDIARELQLKQNECMFSVYLYMRSRPELEIRAGKNGGIVPVGENRTKTAMTPKECALKNYDSVKTEALKTIDEEFTKAEEQLKKQGFTPKRIRLNFQNLAQIIADKLNIKQYASYHCLKSYIEDERPDLIIVLGRHGGLERREQS